MEPLDVMIISGRSSIPRDGVPKPVGSGRLLRALIVSGPVVAINFGLFCGLNGGPPHSAGGNVSQPECFETQIGERRRLALDAHSTVMLNTNSSICLRHSDPMRIEQTRGEVLYDMHSEKKDSLIVSAGPYQISHIGTVFAVRLDDAGLPLVTVKDGSVMLSNDHLAHVDLKGGRQAKVTAQEGWISIVVRTLSDSDIRNQLSWAEGTLIFNSETASLIAQELNRYNRTQIEIMGSALGEHRLGGRFNPSDPLGFAAMLSKAERGVECRLDERFLRIRESTHPGHPDPGWKDCIPK